MNPPPFTYLAALAAFVVHTASFEVRSHAAARPNVILILADDLGYGDLGCYGHPKFKSPHLDRMAAEGVKFTQFHTPAPFCAPTRASLMTGRYPFRCGMTSNPAPDGGPQADGIGMPDTEVTIAQLFKQAGYATGIVGKWHLGHKQREWLPTHRGFDEYLGILYSNDMRPAQLIDGEKVVEYPIIQANLTKRYTDRSLAFIERNRQKPFFLYLAHAMPHKPLAASEAFYKKSGAGLYGDVIAELDWSVGQLLAKLKELKLDEQTLVVFTSDNGPWYGGDTAGLRGMKSTSFQGAFRVPMIARWPGRIPAGRVNDELAVMMDLFATSLKVAGIPLPKDRIFDGRDILPMFNGTGTSPHPYLFGQAGPRLGWIRDRDWILHVTQPNPGRTMAPDENWIDPRGPDGVTLIAQYEQAHPSDFPGLLTGDSPKAMMLFNLKSDPGEQHDVSSQHPDVVQRLKAAHDQMSKDVPLPPAAPAKAKKKQ